MADAVTDISPYKAAWNQFLIQVRDFIGDVEAWFNTLSASEKVIGLCLFAFALLLLIIMQSKAKSDPGSNGRQFGVALTLVVLFAFGAGWTVDTGAGSLSYMFGR